MPENIDAWWQRRQRSKGVVVPYAVGTYRDDWASYPVLKRQYHPEFNRHITLTQIPPAADVYLTWQCEVGHIFVATPTEQRGRPGTARRRSVWCPDCTLAATPPRITPARSPTGPVAPGPPAPGPPTGSARRTPVSASRSASGQSTTPRARRRSASGLPSALSNVLSSGAGVGVAAPESAISGTPRALRPRPGDGGGRRNPGEAFRSARAPLPASAAEAELRQRLADRLELDFSFNAVAVRQPFFERFEVWPDFVFGELRVAIEYDTIGRFGLEHLGSRLDVDRRKDRLLRAVGWEVVRIRCGELPLLGEHDLRASGVTARLVDALLDTLRTLRGDLIVDAYLRPA